MTNKVTLFLLFTIVTLILAVEDCSKDEAIEKFSKKKILNPWPKFDVNPYTNQTEESNKHIGEIINNRTIVCAIKYDDELNETYLTKDFNSKEEAETEGYIVTHQGQCGACSNLQDLALYLKEGLTAPVRKCGFLGVFSTRLALYCIKKLGFSDSCAEIWVYNTINTRKQCFGICMISWIKREPNTKPDGNLNDCLQCDEDKSGPIFKYYSGRTRRNSGIHSEITRPDEQIYNMTQCYY